MKHHWHFILVVLISVTVLSCTRQEPYDQPKILKSVELANARYCKAVQNGDITGILETYTDDATMIPPGGEMVKGKDAIRQVYEGILKGGLKEIKMITIEVGGMDDMVYEIGKTRVLIQPEGLDAIIDSTKYMVIWKKQADGTWKVHADIWNLFRPPANQ